MVRIRNLLGEVFKGITNEDTLQLADHVFHEFFPDDIPENESIYLVFDDVILSLRKKNGEFVTAIYFKPIKLNGNLFNWDKIGRLMIEGNGGES